ncbi:hypothetical protein [Granulosicoccus antarcticus]|nr:hypothetical protein [Granulosicoccus antarcticus]
MFYTDKTQGVDRFRVEQNLPENLVEDARMSSELNSELTPIHLDLKSELESTDLSTVASIQVRRLVWEIAPSSTESSLDQKEDGLADNFNFLESMKLYIAAEVNGERKEVFLAGVNDFNLRFGGNRKQLTMKQNGMDIKEFVEAPGGFHILAHIHGTPPPDRVIFTGKVTYRITTDGS